MPHIHIHGRRWFQRSAGNTYHSTRVDIDGKVAAYIPYAYGYGDQFLDTAFEWLKANGHAPMDARATTLYLRETLGGTYSAEDVKRQKDL